MAVSYINSASANQTGTILTSTSSASLVPGAITEADQWRVTANTNIASATTVITANWERSDNSGAGYVGTGMTQSSGIFTFPSTGYYLITMYGQLGNYNRDVSYCMLGYDLTTDNSNYTKDDGCQTDLTFKAASGALTFSSTESCQFNLIDYFFRIGSRTVPTPQELIFAVSGLSSQNKKPAIINNEEILRNLEKIVNYFFSFKCQVRKVGYLYKNI
jgi:hypothetical protein